MQLKIIQYILFSMVALLINACSESVDSMTTDKPSSIQGKWILDHGVSFDTLTVSKPDSFGDPTINTYEDFYDSALDKKVWATVIEFSSDSVSYYSRSRKYVNYSTIDTLIVQKAPYQIVDGMLKTSIAEIDSIRIDYNETAQELLLERLENYDDTISGTRYLETSRSIITFHRFAGNIPLQGDAAQLAIDKTEPMNEDSTGAIALQLDTWTDPMTISSNEDSDWFEFPVDSGVVYSVDVYSEAESINCAVLAGQGSKTMSYSSMFSPFGENIKTRSTLYRSDSASKCYVCVGKSTEFWDVSTSVRGAYKVRVTKD